MDRGASFQSKFMRHNALMSLRMSRGDIKGKYKSSDASDVDHHHAAAGELFKLAMSQGNSVP